MFITEKVVSYASPRGDIPTILAVPGPRMLKHVVQGWESVVGGPSAAYGNETEVGAVGVAVAVAVIAAAVAAAMGLGLAGLRMFKSGVGSRIKLDIVHKRDGLLLRAAGAISHMIPQETYQAIINSRLCQGLIHLSVRCCE